MGPSTIFKILKKERLAEAVTRMVLYAPDAARNAAAGQFVVIIPCEKGERIPLTIADFDKAKGSVSIIFQEVGFSTMQLGAMSAGDSVAAVLGPLGRPTSIERFGTVVCVAGGVGIAELLPVARAYKKGGNHVVAILGARTKNLLILEDEFRPVCDELLLATDDGSYGARGFVTDILIERLSKGECSLVYCVGPVAMMKRVAELTREKNIRTIASLNPVMVDATGICGVCRCEVAGKTVFGCVDGPEFDAHQVDFDELEKRLKFFSAEESEGKKLAGRHSRS